MEGLGWTVQNHRFSTDTIIGSKQFTNIIATLNSSARRKLVLACHYDSLNRPKGFLGATDSAVPCSMMINLAYVLQEPLKRINIENDLTLELIFFDGEESFKRWTDTDSLYGSRELAKYWKSLPFPPSSNANSQSPPTTELDRIDLFVLLDLIGSKKCSDYFGNSVPCAIPKFRGRGKAVSRWYDSLSDFEQRLRNLRLSKSSRQFDSTNTMSTRGIEDDHKYFEKEGVPILHLMTVPYPSEWHKMSDNFDNLHAQTITDFNTVLRTFVVHYLHLNLSGCGPNFGSHKDEM